MLEMFAIVTLVKLPFTAYQFHSAEKVCIKTGHCYAYEEMARKKGAAGRNIGKVIDLFKRDKHRSTKYNGVIMPARYK